MTAYLMVDIEVKDPEHYKKYVSLVPEFISKYQGRYLVRGGNPQTMEGDWQPERVIVLEFPSRKLAQALFDDPEYQAVANIRRAAAVGKIVLVEGYQ